MFPVVSQHLGQILWTLFLEDRHQTLCEPHSGGAMHPSRGSHFPLAVNVTSLLCGHVSLSSILRACSRKTKVDGCWCIEGGCFLRCIKFWFVERLPNPDGERAAPSPGGGGEGHRGGPAVCWWGNFKYITMCFRCFWSFLFSTQRKVEINELEFFGAGV